MHCLGIVNELENVEDGLLVPQSSGGVDLVP